MSTSRTEQVKKAEKEIENNWKCSCRGYNLDKLLQPQILSLLFHKNYHGYAIIQALEDKDLFHGEKVDPAGIYRTLKKMEEKKLVQSNWEVLEAESPKRIYQITAAGKKCLENWVLTLEDYQKSIDKIIDEAKDCLSK